MYISICEYNLKIVLCQTVDCCCCRCRQPLCQRQSRRRRSLA